jgi:hypothetical protein
VNDRVSNHLFVIQRRCRYCNCAFTPSSHNQKYCSYPCRANAKLTKERPPDQEIERCSYCDGLFMRASHDQKYCSCTCRTNAKLRKEATLPLPAAAPLPIPTKVLEKKRYETTVILIDDGTTVPNNTNKLTKWTDDFSHAREWLIRQLGASCGEQYSAEIFDHIREKPVFIEKRRGRSDLL